jgi:hypothetical protein
LIGDNIQGKGIFIKKQNGLGLLKELLNKDLPRPFLRSVLVLINDLLNYSDESGRSQILQMIQSGDYLSIKLI